MFFLLGARAPYFGAIVGAVVAVLGVVAHSIILTVVGVAALVFGVIRVVNRRRRAN